MIVIIINDLLSEISRIKHGVKYLASTGRVCLFEKHFSNFQQENTVHKI